VPRRLRPRLSLLAAVALGLVAAPASQAQVRGVGARTVTVGGTPQAHVVSRGETLGGIALRYGVTVRQLAERNHLAEPYALRNGQRLQLPHNAADSAPAAGGPHGPGAHPVAASVASVSRRRSVAPRRPAVPARTMMALERTAARGSGRYGRPRRPGMVSLRRLATDERVTTLLRRPNRGVLGLMRRFLRATSGESHPIEAAPAAPARHRERPLRRPAS
jgi:LysM repeat protein